MFEATAARVGFFPEREPHRYGRADGGAGVTVVERTGLSLVGVAARKGQQGALADKVHEVMGVALPQSPQRVAAGETVIVWSAPGQWLVMAPAGRPGTSASDLGQALAGLASVTDQSDSRVIMRVSGPRAHDALAKGVMLDLDPRVFGVGATAVTLVSHISVQISLVQRGEFEFLVPRTFAASFWDWLRNSGASYGVATQVKAVSSA